MDIRHYRHVFNVFAMIVLSMLLGCTLLTKPDMRPVPQVNHVRMIERNGFPDKERKIWVILRAPGLSAEDSYEWRTRCIPDAFKSNGLKNYMITDSGIHHLKSSDIGSDYLLVIILNNQLSAEDNDASERWLSMSAAIYDFPLKRLIVRLGGSATGRFGSGSWNAGEICSSLLTEMIKHMY